MILNEKLKELRMKKGVTQKEVASLLNVSTTQITNMETGDRTPKYESLKQLIKYYEVPKKEELEILKVFLNKRLPDDLFDCQQDIQQIVKEEMTQVELDDFVADHRDKDNEFEIYKNDGLTSMISFLREMDPERRKKSVEMFVGTAKLPLNNFVFLTEIFDTLIEEVDEDVFKKSFGIISMLRTKN